MCRSRSPSQSAATSWHTPFPAARNECIEYTTSSGYTDGTQVRSRVTWVRLNYTTTQVGEVKVGEVGEVDEVVEVGEVG